MRSSGRLDSSIATRAAELLAYLLSKMAEGSREWLREYRQWILRVSRCRWNGMPRSMRSNVVQEAIEVIFCPEDHPIPEQLPQTVVCCDHFTNKGLLATGLDSIPTPRRTVHRTPDLHFVGHIFTLGSVPATTLTILISSFFPYTLFEACKPSAPAPRWSTKQLSGRSPAGT